MKDKFRLKPDKYGTYTLEKYDKDLSVWFTEATSVPTEEQAEKMIDNLKREVKYFNG